MAASPELRRLPSPAELEPRPLPAPEQSGGGGGGEGYNTPATKESAIPAITSCPPAPRKKRRLEISCKRRLLDLELFRVGPELMELLFRPLEDHPSPATKKRKNPCPS